jgi:hypothetical protein
LNDTVITGISSAESTPRARRGPSDVRVAESGGRFHILRDGEIFEIKGAGLEFGSMQALARHGGNAFRNWRTDNGLVSGDELLDQAYEAGLMVAMCIEIGRERRGFNYSDPQAVAYQLERAQAEVLKYKDHPALLAWIIGNEVDLLAKNPCYLDAINDISRMIHEVDGRHPTTTTFAEFSVELADRVRERAPDLDFISIQKYGEIENLPRVLEQAQWDKPYWVTEWGAVGHWEVGKTSWGAPLEQTSSEKAESYRRAWEVALSSDPRLMGSFVFLWGQKQERTPTWYGMFLADGSKTEVIDVLHRLWNGSWPEHRSPQVGTLFLDGKTAGDSVKLAAGSTAMARIEATHPNGKALSYHWEIMHESTATQTGGDQEEVPEIVPGAVVAREPGCAAITAPERAGPYRLFVYVHDEQGHAAHANFPFWVQRG